MNIDLKDWGLEDSTPATPPAFSGATIAMNDKLSPRFDDLVVNFGQRRCIVFDHGEFLFEGKRRKGKADIRVDLQSRKLSPDVVADLEKEHLSYLDRYPEVKRGGTPLIFVPSVIHYEVRPTDADLSLSRVFDLVRDAENFLPYQPPFEETMAEIINGFGCQEQPTSAESLCPIAVPTGQIDRMGKARIGQSSFAAAVSSNYGRRCCFPRCGVDHDSLLVAAHIARWSDAEDTRGDVSNGLCLCGLHDKAFESGLFVLSDDFVVRVIVKNIHDSTWAKSDLLPSDGMRIVLGAVTPSVDAIRAHRERHGL